jgi:NADH-quinone oxidoreductase subunit L
MVEYTWLIPLFPLLAFVLLLAFGRQMKESSAYIGIFAAFASFVLAILVLIEGLGTSAEQFYFHSKFNWLNVGENISFSIGFAVDRLNALMLVIVTLVGLLVNIYSKGYMHGDERFSVFFAYIALFTFSMLGLVISPNLLETYIFWEMVGVCSFLLVGFWYYKPEAKAAAKKAFIVTRIGDVGLFLGILVIFWQVGSLELTEIFNAINTGQFNNEAGMITLAAILIFIGAVGKSGQFPLHTWLPDAMEGPTPISALIHAATMVAAGVYLVARTFPLFEASPMALDVVAYTGAFTAIFAATIGLAQNDIKRILAYSTVSQLGYMMLALGSVGYVAGMFHLMTHAFFKALLFLGAGSVIHAVHTQNIHEMGGVGKHMKITMWTFLIGTLALSGIPPFAGFWSKDAVLGAVWMSGNKGLFFVALIAAFFTALYMGRLFFLTFTGEQRSDFKAHESPASMTVPMVILAILAVVAGFVEMPWNTAFGDWLSEGEAHGGEHAPMWILIASIVVAAAGLLLGWAIYYKRMIPSDLVSKPLPWLNQLLSNKYYIDEIYDYIVVKPLRGLGLAIDLFDHYVVDGIVRTVTGLSVGIGRVGSRLQTGQLQHYGLVTLLGIVLLMIVFVGRRFI